MGVCVWGLVKKSKFLHGSPKIRQNTSYRDEEGDEMLYNGGGGGHEFVSYFKNVFKFKTGKQKVQSSSTRFYMTCGIRPCVDTLDSSLVITS